MAGARYHPGRDRSGPEPDRSPSVATAAHLSTATGAPGPFPEGVAQQVTWLEATLDDADAAANQSVFPEGELFTWEFYSLALFNIAKETKDPADVRRPIAVGANG